MNRLLRITGVLIAPILIAIFVLLNVIQYSTAKQSELDTTNQSSVIEELNIKLEQEVNKNVSQQLKFESIVDKSGMLNNEIEELQSEVEILTSQKDNLLYYIKDYVEIIDYIQITYPEPTINENDEEEVLKLLKEVILLFSDAAELKSTKEGKSIDYVNRDELIDLIENSYVYHISIDSSNTIGDKKEYLIRIDSAVLHQFNEFANLVPDLPAPEPIMKVMFCSVTIGENDISIRLCV